MGNDKLIKLALFLVAFLGYATPLFLPPLAKSMSANIGVEITTIGNLAGLLGLIGGGVSLLAGPISDRIGRRKTLIPLLILNGITSLLFATAWDKSSILILGSLTAFAFGPLVVCALACVGDYFSPNRRGEIVGLLTSAIFMASIVGVPIALIIGEIPGMTWRTAFEILSLLSFSTAILVFFVLPEIKQNSPSGKTTLKTMFSGFGKVFKYPDLVGILGIFLLMRLGVGMYMTYAPSFLLTVYLLPVVALIAIYSAGGVVAFGCSILAGKVMNIHNRKKIIIASNLAMMLAVLAIVYLPQSTGIVFATTLIICLIYMGSESFRTTALQVEAVSRVEPTIIGAFMGLIGFLVSIGSAIGSFIAGGVLDSFKDANALNSAMSTPGFRSVVFCTVALWLLTMFLIMKFITKPSNVLDEKNISSQSSQPAKV